MRALAGAGRAKSAKLFVVSAPSGCGKTTMCNRLLADIPELANSVSMTTRPPRPGEKEGADYIFVTGRKFRDMIRKRGFLEYEENFGNLYGTPLKFVEENIRSGKPVLLSVDVKGAMKVRKAYPQESVLIFLLPPSIAELKKRLKTRRSETGDVINKRLGLAKKELSYKTRYDYRIVNDRLEHAYKILKDTVTAELKKAA